MGRKKAVEFVSPIDRFKNWCGDERVRFVSSMAVFLLSVVMLIGFLSFLFTWKEDQAKFEIGIIRYLCDSDIQVENWGGKNHEKTILIDNKILILLFELYLNILKEELFENYQV